MANASKHHFGAGSQGKGSGVGAMTDPQDDLIEPNMILSNRDKSQHSGQRGLDSKLVQVEQLQDNPANRDVDIPEDSQGNVTGLSGPMSDTSSDKTSVGS
jgi:hypothetical protein